MRFFCCVISCFVVCHFVFCFMLSRVLFHAISCFVSCHFICQAVYIALSLCPYCLFDLLRAGVQLSSELGVLCAYCLIDLLGEGVQLSSELDVLCAYCLFDLLGEGYNPFPLVLRGKVHHFVVGMSRHCNLPQIMR